MAVGVLVPALAAVLALSTSPGPADAREGGSVAGTVTDRAGTPVAGVAVLTSSPAGEVRRTTTTDGAGRYVVGAEAGPVVVCFEPPTAADLNGECWRDSPDRAGATAVDVGPGAAVTGVDAVLDPASHLRGRLVDEEGDPVEDAVVAATGAAASDPRGTGRTDVEGRFDLRLPTSGQYRVCVSDDKRARYLDACWRDGALVDVAEGRSLDGIDLTLRDRSRISGVVTSGDGRSVAGTRVEVVGLPYATTVDDEGRWSLVGPTEGSYRLRFRVPAGHYLSQSRALDVPADGADVTGLRTRLTVAPELRAPRPTVHGSLRPGTSAVLRLRSWDGPVTHQTIRWYVGSGVVVSGNDRRRLYLRPWMRGLRITVVVRASTDRAERSSGRVSSRPSARIGARR